MGGGDGRGRATVGGGVAPRLAGPAKSRYYDGLTTSYPNRTLGPAESRAAADGVSKEDHHMANTAQAKKRARQAEATRKRNASLKSELRTAVKKVKKAIATGDKAAATKTMQESQAVIDKIADKKIVHKNMVSRTKSRLSTAIKALA
jgi:small subunit ribosomal protein S20